MKNTTFACSLRGLNQVVIALFLLLSPLAGAYAACCSGHGGVASCNKSTGHQMCKDGTVSPTCMCAVPKSAAKPKSTKVKPATTTTTTTTPKKPWWGSKSKTTTTTTTAPSTTTKPTKAKKSWWGNTTTTTPASNTKNTSGTSARGCCSRHGGIVDQCDRSTGHQMCKDGTASRSCPCQH